MIATTIYSMDLSQVHTPENKNLDSVPAFSKIEKTHQKIHMLAKEIVANIQKGETAKTESLIETFELTRLELYKALDDLYTS